MQQGSFYFATYYTNLKTLWDELDGAVCATTCRTCDCCKAVEKQADQAKIIKFLAGLNESYAIIRSQIIMKKNIPELSEIYNLLDQDYSQRAFNSVQNATAFHLAAPDQTSMVNATYHHKQAKPICTHCGYTGHTTETCYKIHGYPIDFKHKHKSKSEKVSSGRQQNYSKPVAAQLTMGTDIGGQSIPNVINSLTKYQIEGVIAYFNSQLQPSSSGDFNNASSSGATITALPGMACSSSTLRFIGILKATDNVLASESWIVDSGATHHVACDRSRFETFFVSLNASVTLPTGMGVRIEGVGRVRLSNSLILNNVLYIPDFRLNLMSVSQVTKDLGYRILFDDVSCMIQDHIKGLMIGQGEQVANLYVLETPHLTEALDAESITFSTNVVVDSQLWHNRLGHPSLEKTDILSTVLGLKHMNKTPFHCAICPLAKQKRLSYPSHNNVCDTAFALIHMDIWGPFSVCTTEGYRYFLTLVDDHTRVT